MLKPQARLKQNIGPLQALVYGISLMLGAGIYVLIGDVAAIAGNAMWLSFLAAAFVASFTGLSYAELSSMFPKSSAEYIFVKNAFKNDLMAFVTGWMIIFVAMVSTATVAIGFAGYLSDFFPQVNPILSASALVIILSLVNFIGIKESTWMNAVFTLIELSGLAIVIIAAVILSSGSNTNYFEMPQYAGSTFGALAAATCLVLFAYSGFENLPSISEETRNAPKVIPRAVLLSIVVTTIVYLAVILSAISLVGWKELSSSSAPLAFAAEKAFGRAGTILLSAIALFATSNTALMILISGSRIIFGMAKEEAIPGAIAKVHQTRNTPWLAVVIIMIFAVVIIVSSRGNIQVVAAVAVFGTFIVYGMVNFALIWLRYKEPNRARPFRSPIRISKFPLLAGLGLVTVLVMLTQFDLNTLLAGVGTIAAGLVVYAIIYLFKKGKTQSKSAHAEHPTEDFV